MESMKASQLIKNLQSLIDEYGDLEVVYAIDAEGNGFDRVYYSPVEGYFDEGDFSPQSGEGINAICIN